MEGLVSNLHFTEANDVLAPEGADDALEPEHLHGEIGGSGDEQLPQGISDRSGWSWTGCNVCSMQENMYLTFGEGGKLQLVHLFGQGKLDRVVSFHLSKKFRSKHIVTIQRLEVCGSDEVGAQTHSRSLEPT